MNTISRTLDWTISVANLSLWTLCVELVFCVFDTFFLAIHAIRHWEWNKKTLSPIHVWVWNLDWKRLHDWMIRTPIWHIWKQIRKIVAPCWTLIKNETANVKAGSIDSNRVDWKVESKTQHVWYRYRFPSSVPLFSRCDKTCMPQWQIERNSIQLSIFLLQNASSWFRFDFSVTAFFVVSAQAADRTVSCHRV